MDGESQRDSSLEFTQRDMQQQRQDALGATVVSIPPKASEKHAASPDSTTVQNTETLGVARDANQKSQDLQSNTENHSQNAPASADGALLSDSASDSVSTLAQHPQPQKSSQQGQKENQQQQSALDIPIMSSEVKSALPPGADPTLKQAEKSPSLVKPPNFSADVNGNENKLSSRETPRKNVASQDSNNAQNETVTEDVKSDPTSEEQSPQTNDDQSPLSPSAEIDQKQENSNAPPASSNTPASVEEIAAKEQTTRSPASIATNEQQIKTPTAQTTGSDVNLNVKTTTTQNELETSRTHDETVSKAPTAPESGSRKSEDIATVQKNHMPQEIAEPSAFGGQAYKFMDTSERKISFLEVELAKAQSVIESLQSSTNEEDKSSLLVELQMDLQAKLQGETKLKLEAEERALNAEKRITVLEGINSRQAAEIQQLASNVGSLQKHMNARAEAENKARQAAERVDELERETQRQKFQIEEYDKLLAKQREQIAAQEKELLELRERRDEHERLEMSHASRLNIAKKRESEKANLAEKYEDLMMSALREKDQAKKELQEMKAVKEEVVQQLHELNESSRERILEAEARLEEEKKLNKERKEKMKAFVESKAEELRQSKEDNDGLQLELAQTNKSLVDLNNRWTQLHSQWVQAQTRNRELQRDLNRIKKDSENLHKVGDTLEMKLSRSANETEEHKNKRLAAKQELMTVLRTLDNERQVTTKLKDSLKFKFTPKALSQQQSLQDGMNEFERQLLKLAARLGKPLPPKENNPNNSQDSSLNLEANGSHGSQSETDVAFLIGKLEHETQRVSDSITQLCSDVTRMRMLIDASGDRTCATVLSELMTASGLARAAVSTQEESQTSSQPRRTLIPSHRYGQISASDDN